MRSAAPARFRRVIRLWLPLTPLFAMLAPFALLLAPLGYLVRRRSRVNPIVAADAIGRVLVSLSGTEITIERAHVFVRITIF